MTTVTVHVTMMLAMIVFMARMIVIETVIMMVAAIHAPSLAFAVGSGDRGRASSSR
jgi:hypothetical protein